MTAQVRLLDEAVAELEDASSWYEEQRRGLGLVFLAAVQRTIDRVSRWPFTGSLVDGVDEVLELPHHMAGTHRRVEVADLLEYRDRRDHERSDALTEMHRIADEAGMDL